MARFTSDRERRLWIWAAATLVAIFVGLGLAGTLAGELRDRGLLSVAFAACFLLVLIAIAGSALRRRAGRRELWAILGLAAVYGMIFVRMGIGPEERTHLFEYGLLAVLLREALVERRRGGGRVPWPGALAVVATALLGWLDEGVQAVLPGRVYDLRDVGVNAAAGALAVAGAAILEWARRWDVFARRTRPS